MVQMVLMVVRSHDSVARYVFQFLLVFFPKVADQVLTEQVEKHHLDHGKDGDEDD